MAFWPLVESLDTFKSQRNVLYNEMPKVALCLLAPFVQEILSAGALPAVSCFAKALASWTGSVRGRKCCARDSFDSVALNFQSKVVGLWSPN